MNEISQRIITRKEVLKLFGITHPTLLAWVRSGYLPSPFRMGGRIYWDVLQLQDLIDSKRNKKND